MRVFLLGKRRNTPAQKKVKIAKGKMKMKILSKKKKQKTADHKKIEEKSYKFNRPLKKVFNQFSMSCCNILSIFDISYKTKRHGA